jgi:hypothetical protein
MLLKSDGSDDARPMRLEQEGLRLVVTLEDSRDQGARAWRLDAYVAVYEALGGVLGLVFRGLSLRAATKCDQCNRWTFDRACKHTYLLVGGWRPLEGDKLVTQYENWSLVTGSVTTIVPKTASTMRVVYFSASPLHKTPAKTGEWPKLDWKAGFDEVQRATDAVTDRRVALSFEFHDKGTLDELARVLTADNSITTILVIACHGDEETGELQFADGADGTLARKVDADDLFTALRHLRRQPVLTVFSSCRSLELAASIQHLVQVPSFVTFGADELSLEHSTIFLRELLCDLVGRPIGTPLSAVVKRAKEVLLDLAKVDVNMQSFATQIAWLTGRTTPIDS